MSSLDPSFQSASDIDEAMLDRFRGCLVGGAVGDALGYTVEFMGEHEIFSRYGASGITSYEHDSASGKALVSDDTQMTLFTAAGLLRGRTQEVTQGAAENPRRYVADAYQDWLVTQETSFDNAKSRREGGDWNATSWIVDVPELFDRRAPGNTCLSALRRHRSAGDTIDDYIAFAPHLNNSKGCGGVMRAAPVGLAWTGGSIDSVDVESAQIAAVTHGHSLGYMPAAVLSHIVARLAVAGTGLEEAVLDARDTAARLFADDAHIGELTRIIDRAVELSKNDDSDLNNIHRLGEGWVGEEALAVGIYCAIRHRDNFSAAVIAAVNHSGDSDSTGAVCGNILGALLGYDVIGEQWKRDLELLDVTLELADDLYRGFQTPLFGDQIDYAWRAKYVHFYHSEDGTSAVGAAFPGARSDEPSSGREVTGNDKEIVDMWTMGFGVMGGSELEEKHGKRPRRHALRSDWKTLPMPLEHVEINLDLRITTPEFEHLAMGHIPRVMEDHWFMYFDGDAFCFHRSWTGICVFKVHVAHEQNGGGYVLERVTVNRDRCQYSETSDERDRLMVAILVGQALGKDVESLWEARFAIKDDETDASGKGKRSAIGFWKENEALGCLSNWYGAGFELFGQKFETSEHWLMWQKARVMGDWPAAAAIMKAKGPRAAKDLGGKVSPYDDHVWRDVREQLAYVGIREKFLQNPDIARELLSTGNAVLAEASPYDRVWGVGIRASDSGFADMTGWRGENLLGRICMRVRADLGLLISRGMSGRDAMTTKDDAGGVLASTVGDMSLLSLARNPIARPYALCYARICVHRAHMNASDVHRFLMYSGKATLAEIEAAIHGKQGQRFTTVGWYELLVQLSFLRRVGLM